MQYEVTISGFVELQTEEHLPQAALDAFFQGYAEGTMTGQVAVGDLPDQRLIGYLVTTYGTNVKKI